MWYFVNFMFSIINDSGGVICFSIVIGWLINCGNCKLVRLNKVLDIILIISGLVSILWVVFVNLVNVGELLCVYFIEIVINVYKINLLNININVIVGIDFFFSIMVVMGSFSIILLEKIFLRVNIELDILFR